MKVSKMSLKEVNPMRIMSLCALLMLPAFSHATAITNTDMFYPLYNFVASNLNGGLGVAIALVAFLISLVIAGASQSVMPILVGIILAVGISFGPQMIEDIITSGTMLPLEVTVQNIKL